MTWTVLPQGFRDSSHLFGQALSQDLLDLDLGPNRKILQYIDDLLNSGSKPFGREGISSLQMVKTKVTNLGAYTLV